MTVSHFIKTSFPPAALKCHKRIVRSYYFLRFLISNVVITLRTSLKTITWSCWSTFAKSRSRKEIQIACIYFPCGLKKKKKKKKKRSWQWATWGKSKPWKSNERRFLRLFFTTYVVMSIVFNFFPAIIWLAWRRFMLFEQCKIGAPLGLLIKWLFTTVR